MAVDGHPHARDVDLEIGHPDDVAWLIAAVDAAEERTHPRHQLLRAERFHDVVVRTQLQPDDTVGFVAAGGHDHDWDIRGAAQLAGDVQPVPTRQTQVEHYQIRTRQTRALQGALAVGRHTDRESGRMQIVPDDARDLRLVFDYEDVLHHCHRTGAEDATRESSRAAHAADRRRHLTTVRPRFRSRREGHPDAHSARLPAPRAASTDRRSSWPLRPRQPLMPNTRARAGLAVESA